MDQTPIVSEDTQTISPEPFDGPLANLSEDLLLSKYDEKGNRIEEDKKEEVKEEKEEEKKTDETEKEEEKTEEEEPDDSQLYTADDVEDPEEEIPEVPEKNAYIAERLPQVSVRIMVGDEVKTVSVISPNQLPEGFKFASDAESANFSATMAEQVNRYFRLQDEWEGLQRDAELARFRASERAEIKQDIAELQKEGLLSKFTRGKSIAEDPRAELAREVMNFYEEENQRRLEVANSGGRPYSRITYRDAFEKYIKDHPIEPKESPKKAEVEKEDEERKERVKKTAKTNKGLNDEGEPKNPLSNLINFV